MKDVIQARPYGGGGATGGTAKKTAKTRRRTAPTNGYVGNTAVVSAGTFARFERCMKNPKEPSSAILKGAELLRSLRKSR